VNNVSVVAATRAREVSSRAVAGNFLKDLFKGEMLAEDNTQSVGEKFASTG